MLNPARVQPPKNDTVLKTLMLPVYAFLAAAQVACFPATPPVSFVRTDMPPAITVFDPGHKVVYVSVPDLSEVIAISTQSHRVTATISIPGALGMDISPDGTTLAVGSGNSDLGGNEAEFITLVDTSTLQVTRRSPLPQIGLSYDTRVPFSLAWTSNGTILILAQQGGTTGFQVIQWDPVQDTFRARRDLLF